MKNKNDFGLEFFYFQGGVKAPAGGGGGQPAQIAVDTIRRDEVNAVLANQREIVSASRDIK